MPPSNISQSLSLVSLVILFVCLFVCFYLGGGGSFVCVCFLVFGFWGVF